MNADKLRSLVKSINQAPLRSGGKAPHKPLLLLYVLGRLQNRQPRDVSFREVKPVLIRLLQLVGPRPNDKKYRPDYPFVKLVNDKLWEVLPPKIAELSKKRFLPIKTTESLDFEKARGALPFEVYCLLMEQPNLIDEIAEYLLEKNWSPTLHAEIRQNVGLRLSSYRLMLKYPLIASLFNDEGRKRDPRFREEVLTAYGYRCCVCGSDLRLNNYPFDLEAAHIKWHAHDGPDEVANGLALCGFHHNSFDRGVWVLKPQHSDLVVHVSDGLSGRSSAINLLRDFQDCPIYLPDIDEYHPSQQYVRWHQNYFGFGNSSTETSQEI